MNIKTAVITGAASGIGSGLAIEAVRRGLNVVLADVDSEGLEHLAASLVNDAVRVIHQQVDVSDYRQQLGLAKLVEQEFGGADLLFNNAGIMVTGRLEDTAPEAYSKVMSVNALGVMHGTRAFLPQMSASESYSHIVNTASVGGLLSWHSMSSYGAAKAAVVAFTEALHYEYQKQSNLGFSVLCPGTVQSNIFQESLEHGDAGEHGKEMAELMDGQLKAYGMSPQELAKITFDAIEERRYWIFTHPEFKPEYKRRVDVLLSEQIPDADLCLYGA